MDNWRDVEARKQSSGHHPMWNIEECYRRGMIQSRREIEALAAIVEEMRPEVILEIGCASGGSLLLWRGIAAMLVIGVDRGNPHLGAEERGPDVVLIQGDSHDEETVGKVIAALDGSTADVLFIDGDHSYESCKRDFENYRLLVRPGGIIAFHDITCDREPEFGVRRFWRELAGDKLELVAGLTHDEGDGPFPICGIGVLFTS